MLERIFEKFWAQYALSLSFLMALYFLIREKLDYAIFSIGDSIFTKGEYSNIILYFFIVLTLYPLYRIQNKGNKFIIVPPLLAYFLFPISLWYLIQLSGKLSKSYYWLNYDLFNTILFFTTLYSILYIIQQREKPKNEPHSASFPLTSDEPIQDKAKDQLGFSLYANSISTNIYNVFNNKHAFVFGIEGGWGSGKTSFINLVKENLKKHSSVQLLDFNPWLSSSIHQMTSDFFSLIAENTSTMQLKMKFRQYGNALATADGTGVVAKVVENISPSQDLRTMLESINSCIVREKLRFIVFIDDTDRLDKEELLAMFKMVRNTANFSNTIFVLTYDRNYVESALKAYFEDESIARSYLDKIVNFQFELPSSSKDYFEILKEMVNGSEFKKANPEIELNNSDLPENFTVLFNNIRKVKRVFNALVVESAFPHFKKIPIKYSIIFFYISFYRKEEYDMLRDAFDAANGDIQFNRRKQDEETSSQFMLRLIQESKGVYDPITGLTLTADLNKRKQTNDEREKEQDIFNKKYHLLYYLLTNNPRNNPFVKYIDYLLKYNAIHYKEYKERYDKYGIDGFKGVALNISNAAEILNRLIVIKENFNEIFYAECADDTFYKFYKGSETISVGLIDLETHFQLLLALALSTSNPLDSLNNVIFLTNSYYDNFGSVDINLLAVLEKLDDTSASSSDPCIKYYNQFDLKYRTYLKTCAYQQIISQPDKYMFFNADEVITSSIIFLENVTKKDFSYDIVEDAFFACRGIENNKRIINHIIIDKRACEIFKKYIERSPDEFIEECIRDADWEKQKSIVFFPCLMQVFDNSKEDVRNYFKSVVCKSKKSQSMLDMIQKYLEDYLSIDELNNRYKMIAVSEKDYDQIFSYSDKIEEPEVQEVLEPQIIIHEQVKQ